MAKKTVVIGFLGTKLDSGSRPDRWSKWRPTVDTCQQEDLQVDSYELLYEDSHSGTAQQVIDDIHQVSPHTKVTGHKLYQPLKQRRLIDFLCSV